MYMNIGEVQQRQQLPRPSPPFLSLSLSLSTLSPCLTALRKQRDDNNNDSIRMEKKF